MFYRYIRPIKFNEDRMELETHALGGVCLRFDEHADGKLWFAHARCHDKELFSKEVAKKIADHRAQNAIKHGCEGLFGRFQYSKDTALLCEQVVDWCENWKPPSRASIVMSDYLAQELYDLAKSIAKIMSSNVQETIKAEIWKSGVQAINSREMYKKISEVNEYD